MWIAVIGAWFMTVYVKRNFTNTEFDIRRKRPSLFVPRIIYRIRRDHYIYWEISRLARGLPKTFTYSNWDPNAVSSRFRKLKWVI
jgi:hypothetical protein